MSDSPIIQTQFLSKRYGAFQALDSLSIDVPAGSVMGILGPNGAGKSTAIRILLGFLRPSSGSAQVAGYDCWKSSVEVRRRVSYLPGELRLYENMTGQQLLDFLGNVRGLRNPVREQHLARQFDIQLNRPLTQLSSGMKRKIALLLVLSPDVPIIILDEPTNTLDPTMRDALLDQLQEAKKRGQTIVFSSHVLSEVETLCDEVAILKSGRLMHRQQMEVLRSRRRIEVQFAVPPKRELPGLTWESVTPQGLYIGEYLGEIGQLFAYLALESTTDLQIRPVGLRRIYHQFHPASVLDA
ncbi:ABC transporter ATP-binding protein [Tuwongella immobilis]|uniref:ABC transporter domain-containing protein n=1 Tax=Tuwongella immobilis TaxID=692036 RepID=A0A6C2YNG5_9BACT|nr:ABC transporter ATP-binding protein [Tuwongella immobilis]VIP02432.1 abc transporter atp-binding protein : ABC transporter related protein OS=Pirellula staleyi (strain ATCC 27377 / DSM 6068 / ICPB 4128) GN=Psta_4539 PE=4 SV=1: ABC_tran [Tuwongella immobilis]VTS01380.1 abc transporter atp-binding protein : ABC transporter related protein OS=Pirellula staleyi (strain ATCC 27377 / DSM 6068 / ICPB 4128) GN=Psta_4539 PE=4 SV=1: ABC_tran [Tuwongella immobilis]